MHLRTQNRLITIVMLLALIILAIDSCGCSPPGELVTETYIVRPGDNLWAIAEQYVVKNTYGPRDIREFICRIEELNYDSVFKNRKPGEIHPGDKLTINYWIKKENR